jgi:hypothetical protein
MKDILLVSFVFFIVFEIVNETQEMIEISADEEEQEEIY